MLRYFDRTLCVPRQQGEALRRLGSNLPEPVRPLSVNAVDAGDWFDVLTLPPSGSIPLEVVWLSRERSDDELWSDFGDAIEDAARAIAWLINTAPRVLDLLPWPEDLDDESRFVARWWFADHAQAAIQALLPRVGMRFDDDWFTVEVESGSAQPFRVGQPGDVSWFSRLSSGERALFDEALVDAAQALRADMNHVLATVAELYTSDPELLFDLQVEMETGFRLLGEGFWHRHDVEALVAWGKRRFQERHGRALRPDVSVVRLFDEPERHLHPSAQSEFAAVLHDRITSSAIVISTHSSEFLARDGWQHMHLMRSPEGIVVEPFEPGDLERAHAVARDLGLRSGDLLTRYRYVLFVEGPHDEAFLDGYCGGLLRSLGVLVLPMHGADEVLQAAQAHFFTRHLDVGLGVLVDHASHRDGSLRRSKEGQLVKDLRREAKGRGLMVDDYLLVRPDIIAYLDDDEVRKDAPAFPGFAFVESKWRQSPRSVQFKTIASEMAGGFRFTRTTIRDLSRTQRMATRSRPCRPLHT